MADEAAIVGVSKRGYWAAACSRCDWIYQGKCLEVDSVARGHCRDCGGDVVAMTNPGKKVVLRLERDVAGRVVPGHPTPEVLIEDPVRIKQEYEELLQDPDYWVDRRNKSGYEDE